MSKKDLSRRAFLRMGAAALAASGAVAWGVSKPKVEDADASPVVGIDLATTGEDETVVTTGYVDVPFAQPFAPYFPEPGQSCDWWDDKGVWGGRQ